MTEISQQKKVPYVRLGKSGLKVSKIILGTMQYGSTEWQPWLLDEEEAIKHIKVAYEAGIQSFDTANVYSNGLSEIILGKAIKQLKLPRDEIVIMTKVYGTVAREYKTAFWANGQNPDEHGYVNQHGLSRKHIFESVKHSLERLQLDYIDLLQCHRFDYDTPIEETMQALHDVVQAGYVRYIGMSSCFAWQFQAMQNYAINNKLTPFISMQNHYNLLYREEEREMFPTLKLFGVGSIPWSPLARGVLTRPYGDQTKRGTTDPAASRYANAPGTPDVMKRVEEVSKKLGISMAQVSIAWMLSKEGVTAPIVGTTSLKNLEDIIAGVHVELSEEDIKYIEEPYKPTAVFGHMYSNGLSEIILGKAIKELNLPRDEIVVMTKLYNVVGRDFGTNMLLIGKDPEELGYVNQRGLSRKHIFQAVKHSLERLQLDYIDVLQCHRFDNNTPIEETMQALHDVVQAGYVRYLGMSSCWAWQFHAMQNYAIQNKLTPFISMQNHHNLLYREEEREMFPTLKLFGVGCIPWSPLARGLLTRPLDGEKTQRGSTDWFIGRYSAAESTPEILKRVEEVAKKKGISMAQVAVAWSLHKDVVTAPIVGTTSLKNLEDIIGTT
ncbi:hypothetical protein CVT26_015657, partial [Gymnopilus dilepis]